MLIGDLVPWHVNISDWPALHEKLPKHFLAHSLVQIANVNRGFLISFEKGLQGCHREILGFEIIFPGL